MKKIAVFPGSFDPFTLGHYDIVERATCIFDKVVIALGKNTSKNNLFSLEKREKMINACFSDNEKAQVKSFTGLTVNFCQSIGAGFIIRGIRNTKDFEYERNILEMNKKMVPGIETVLLTTTPEYGAINSSIVREIIKSGGDAGQFLPEKARGFLED